MDSTPNASYDTYPPTIEAFMKTHAESTPTMRVTKLHDVTTEDFIEMICAATSRDGPKKGKQDSTEGPRKSVDIYCDACGTPMGMDGVTVIFSQNYSRQWNLWLI